MHVVDNLTCSKLCTIFAISVEKQSDKTICPRIYSFWMICVSEDIKQVGAKMGKAARPVYWGRTVIMGQ